MISSPLNQVYCTGEVGFVYGQWSGKGNGDYWQSYVWGQAGNDQIPDQCRRFVRELERKLTENSRLSFFEIGAASPRSSNKVDRLVPKTMGFDSPKAQKSGRMNSQLLARG